MTNELNDQVQVLLSYLARTLSNGSPTFWRNSLDPEKANEDRNKYVQQNEKEMRSGDMASQHGSPQLTPAACFPGAGQGETAPEPCTHQPPSPRHPSQIQSARPRYTHCNHLRRDVVATSWDHMNATLPVPTVLNAFSRCGH